MRVNIYAEELTDRVELITKVIEGQTYTAVRFYMELPVTVTVPNYAANDIAASTKTQNVRGPFMHRPGDDDSAAVTFWGKHDLQRILRKALDKLEEHYATKEIA
jgi:hypothetical protein